MKDRLIDIATGEARTAKTWKNSKQLWSDFAKKLSVPVRTKETLAEYAKMSKEQKSKLKDVGGFVAGYCDGGKRTRVKHRSCLTLDADSVVSDVWADWCDLYGYAAALYSTHSHTEGAPRYRLIIPTNRDMSPDEYEAVSRRIADTLGNDNFDASTHQPARLMYWPSCSCDAKYVFELSEGELLNVDEVLDTYTDWRDVTSWPNLGTPAEKPKKGKQQDPLEKDSIVGTFCRAFYPIQNAIEKFIPTYAPCDNGRYTYTEGSSAQGVVVYEDKWTYSNHATDPAAGIECNAFDLVRLHKFGHLDEDVPEGQMLASRPSYKAMCDWVANLDEYKLQLAKEKRADTEAFDNISSEDDDLEWVKKLKTNGSGGYIQNIANVVTVLTYDPKFKGRLAYDEMGRRILKLNRMPWDPKKAEGKTARWEDHDDAALRLYLEGIGLQGKDRIYDAVENVAHRNSVHPVKDFIEAVEWDGVERAEKLFIDYLGVEDTPYTRTVTRKTLAGAVARIYHPGCKFDYVLSLRGNQGMGKSSILRKLAGEWFSDSLVSMTGKEAFEQLSGVWIMELGELASLKRSEIENVKNFLSAQEDKYRPAYGRRVAEYKRQCIFVATTNETLFLRDKTGNRRFWVLECKEKHPKEWSDLTESDVHQIWAEAKTWVDAGEKLYLDKEMESIAQTVQERFSEEDPQISTIENYLERLLPDNWADKDTEERRLWLEDPSNRGTVMRTTVCSKEIAAEAFGIDPRKLTSLDLKNITTVMSNKMPDWVRGEGNDERKRVPLYGLQRIYIRKGYGTDWVRTDTEDEDDFML